jgi:hypothetical protein
VVTFLGHTLLSAVSGGEIKRSVQGVAGEEEEITVVCVDVLAMYSPQ